MTRETPSIFKELPLPIYTILPDILEEGMATQSDILAWKILWTEEPGGLSHCKELATNEATEHANTLLPFVVTLPYSHWIPKES